MSKVKYENGVATFNPTTIKRLAKAAEAVKMDVEGFIEHAIDETMRAAIECEQEEKKAFKAELDAACKRGAENARAKAAYIKSEAKVKARGLAASALKAADLKLQRAKTKAGYALAEVKAATKRARALKAI